VSSTVDALVGCAGLDSYTAAKGGVTSMVRSFAAGVGRDGVRYFFLMRRIDSQLGEVAGPERRRRADDVAAEAELGLERGPARLDRDEQRVGQVGHEREVAHQRHRPAEVGLKARRELLRHSGIDAVVGERSAHEHAPCENQHRDGGDEERVVGERREELRRHDDVEA